MKGKPLGRIRTRRKLRPPTQQQERSFREQYFETHRMLLAQSLKRFRWWSKRLATATVVLVAIFMMCRRLPMGPIGAMIFVFVLFAWMYPALMWLIHGGSVLDRWSELRKGPPDLMEESLRTRARLY